MKNNQLRFEELRRTYPTFIYRSFRYTCTNDRLVIGFHFIICNHKGEEAHSFRPELGIPLRKFYRHPDTLPSNLLDTLVFHCGMVELVSYWKCCCCPEVKIECGQLDASRIEWFKKLYFYGLGEFFYLNGIRTDRRDFMLIHSEGPKTESGKETAGTHRNAFYLPEKTEKPNLDERIIVPIGGGKDSVVSLEILRRMLEIGNSESAGKSNPNSSVSYRKADIRPMIINPRGATRNCCLQAGFEDEDCIVIERSIDKHLLELNERGFLNGHTPFSAMLAFTSLIAAALNNSRYIALSNENSADESTVPGQNINHQYSKSLEFENDFRAYVKEYICSEFDYFSFLRPLSEVGIARLFAALPAYHSVFRSCNAGSKTDSWCGKCPKCLFAFIILSPFMGLEKTSRLFGKNLFDDTELQAYIDELTGTAPVKPFECVGTKEEVNWALQQLRPVATGHPLLEYYFSLPVSRIPVSDRILEDYADRHNLPASFSAALQEAVNRVRRIETDRHRVLPPLTDDLRRNFLPFFDRPGHIALVGLGREGISTYKLIRRLLPEKKLILADADPDVPNKTEFAEDTRVVFLTGPDYLDKLGNELPALSLIMKSPGVSFKHHPDLLSSPILSSQTDIFLRIYARQVIGITGTKGKSTTTLLTCHLLSPFLPCIQAGNMGIPLFDIIDEINDRSCIICEFSAHQLEQARQAPHTSVLLNLYQEHLDHYRSFEAYQLAKMNIAGDPTRDTVIFHEDDPLIRARLKARFPEYPDLLEKPLPRYPGLQSYSLTHPVKNGLFLHENRIEDQHGNPIFDLSRPHPLIGTHNILNLMAALSAARTTGISYARLSSRIASFQPLPHRLQYIGCINGSHYFNDSISTIPQATIAAIQSISALPYVKGIDCLIVGGMDRGIDYTPLVDFLRQHKLENIIFAGAAGTRIKTLLAEADIAIPHSLQSDNYPELVTWAKHHTRPGYACLLSPAAASYDHFKNFAHRGQVFTTLVKTHPPHP